MKLWICMFIVLLSGCAGVQHIPPTASEDAAELSVVDKTPDGLIKGFTADKVSVINFDAKGCFSGSTEVEDKIMLHAGKPIVIARSKNVYEKLICQTMFSFVPTKNAKYLITKSIAIQCEPVVQNLEKLSEVIPTTKTSLAGYGCLRGRELPNK